MEIEPYPSPKIARRWLGAAYVLAWVCITCSPVAARAQTETAATPPAAKTGTTSTTHPKARAKAPASASKVSLSSSANVHSAHRVARKNSKKKTARGQQKIEPERAEAIQEALIREHYLSGEPAGTWNQASEDAMRRYQADHGWQSKTVPDSRALISLGLGPSHDHLLNPESAMTTGPEVSHSASVTSSQPNPVTHSAAPGARVSTTPAVGSAPGTSSDHDASGP